MSPYSRCDMAKVRVHREHFFTVALGGRKSCPTCRTKNAGQLYGWYEYIRCKKHLVKHFCEACYPVEVHAPLQEHAKPCGCAIELVYYGGTRPTWLVPEIKNEVCTVPTDLIAA